MTQPLFLYELLAFASHQLKFRFIGKRVYVYGAFSLGRLKTHAIRSTCMLARRGEFNFKNDPANHE
jgi:hypothetical protein